MDDDLSPSRIQPYPRDTDQKVVTTGTMVKTQSSMFKQKKGRRVQFRDEQAADRQRKNSPSSFGMIKKKEKSSSRVLMKKLHNSRVIKKAKKSIKRLEVEIAEKRGYTMCLKQLLMEEAKVMESAIQEMEEKLGRMKMKKEIAFAKNEYMEQFIASMLAIVEAEDALL